MVSILSRPQCVNPLHPAPQREPVRMHINCQTYMNISQIVDNGGERYMVCEAYPKRKYSETCL